MKIMLVAMYAIIRLIVIYGIWIFFAVKYAGQPHAATLYAIVVVLGLIEPRFFIRAELARRELAIKTLLAKFD